MTNTNNNELYAFWKYDCPPFVLGGKVKEVLDDGCVTITSYYPRVFEPIAIVPLEKGLELQKRIDDIEYKYKAAIKIANHELNLSMDLIKDEMKTENINNE